MWRVITVVAGKLFRTRGEKAEETREMGFFDHLEELRQTIFRCLLAFAFAMGLTFFYAKEIFAFMRLPLETAIANNDKLRAAAEQSAAAASGNDPLGAISALAGLVLYGEVPAATTPAATGAHVLAGDGVSVLKFMDVFNILMNIGLLGGLTLSSPFILFFAGKFVAPALTEREKKCIVPFCVAALALFVSGALFSFFWLMPLSVEVMFHFNEWLGLRMNWVASDYYGLVTTMTLLISLTFEFPLLVIILQYLEVIQTATLVRIWRHMLVGILVGSLIITPLGDPISLSVLTGVLFGLYMAAVAIGGLLVRAKKKRHAKEEAEYEREYRERKTPALPEKSTPENTGAPESQESFSEENHTGDYEENSAEASPPEEKPDVEMK